MTGMSEGVRVAGAEGVSLAGDLSGPVDGPFVMLMHGGGQTRHSWGATAEVLANRGYRVLSLDLRGHGDSDRSPDQVYSVERHASDVVAAVRNMSPGPAILIGASLGGLASLVAAPQLEGRVRAIVLVDVATRVRREGAERILGFMRRHLGGFSSLEEAAEAVAAYRPEAPRRTDHRGLAKNLRLQPDGRYYWHWDPAIMLRRPADDEVIPTAVLDEAAGSVRVPTLLVRGRLSDVVDDHSVATLRSLIPHLQVAEVRNAGHMVVGDNNAVFEDVILSFLDQLPPVGVTAA